MVGWRAVLLPDGMYEPQIKDININQEVYTLPWGMMVDMDGRCYLCGTYTTSIDPMGTSRMLVRRESDGYYVRLCPDHKYSPSRSAPWMGATDDELIPVKGFI